jgi:hypothetical protein
MISVLQEGERGVFFHRTVSASFHEACSDGAERSSAHIARSVMDVLFRDETMPNDATT